MKEKVAIKNSNSSLQFIEYFNELLVQLKNLYEDQQIEIFQERIRLITSAAANKQSFLVWNEISDRNSTNKSKLKAKVRLKD